VFLSGAATKEETITLVGKVEQLIDPTKSRQPQQAQIVFAGADYHYDQLRIFNVHAWKAGKTVELTIRLI
jgi:hypothetical protein